MCSLEWMDVGREHGRFNLLEALGERQEGARNPRKEAADILLPHWCWCWIRVFLSVDGATFGHTNSRSKPLCYCGSSWRFLFTHESLYWRPFLEVTVIDLLTERIFFPSFSQQEGKSSFAAAAAKSLQSCPTLCDPIDGSPPGSAVPGILQARTLEWVAISFSNA